MIGVTVDASGAQRKLGGMIQRAGDLKPVMALLGRHMMASTRKTFDVGGRPVTWPPPANVEIKPKGKRGKGRVQGRARMGGLLVKTGDLRRSVGFTAESHDLVLWDRPSNDEVKAPVHQWGAEGAGRGHRTNIPARPYLVFQREDIDYCKDLLSGFIRLGATSGGSS